MANDYYKLGVEGEGFFFFLPDTYKKDTIVIGTGLKRTVTGAAKRDIITTKKVIELGFSDASDYEYVALYTLFERNIERGQILTFEDETDSYEVMWGSENFGLADRVADDGIFWSGTVVLEEI